MKLNKTQAIAIIDNVIKKHIKHDELILKRYGLKDISLEMIHVDKFNYTLLYIKYLDKNLFEFKFKLHDNEKIGSMYPTRPTVDLITHQALWLASFDDNKLRKKRALNDLLYKSKITTAFNSILSLRTNAVNLKSSKQILDYLVSNDIMIFNDPLLDSLRLQKSIKDLGIDKFDDFNGRQLGMSSSGKLYCLFDNKLTLIN